MAGQFVCGWRDYTAGDTMSYLDRAANFFRNAWPSLAPTEAQTIEQTIQETAEQHLESQARLDSLGNLIMVDDLEQIAFDDREKVRQYEAVTAPGRNPTPESGAKVGRAGGKGSRAGHILGDVSIQQAPPKPIAGSLIALGAMALLGALGWKWLDSQQPHTIDTDTTTDFVIMKDEAE